MASTSLISLLADIFVDTPHLIETLRSRSSTKSVGNHLDKSDDLPTAACKASAFLYNWNLVDQRLFDFLLTIRPNRLTEIKRVAESELKLAPRQHAFGPVPLLGDLPPVFISFRRHNDAFVSQVRSFHKNLVSSGIPALIDEMPGVADGTGWLTWMSSAIQRAPIIVMFISHREDEWTTPHEGGGHGVRYERAFIEAFIYSSDSRGADRIIIVREKIDLDSKSSGDPTPNIPAPFNTLRVFSDANQAIDEFVRERLSGQP